MNKKIDRLAAIFEEMAENYNTFGMQWANVPLAKEGFEIIRELPDRVEGEYETAAEKAVIVCNMIEHVEEFNCPRFCIEVREYADSLFGEGGDEDNNERLARLRDYIDPKMSMEEFCSRHRRLLKFDPVERTEEWEKVYYEVQLECERRLEGEPKCMGYCFMYWSTMTAVLSEYGISWRSPSRMNPGVMFD